MVLFKWQRRATLGRSRTRLIPFALLAAGAALVVSGHSAEAQQVIAPDLTEELAVVRAAMDSPELRAAMTYVDRVQSTAAERDLVIQEWIGICNAYGPSGDEIFRSRHIAKLFKIYGLEKVHIDDEWNVIGIRPGAGGGPNIVLNAHHDVVAIWPKEQPIESFVADDRIWCPGAGDDLIGVVQMLTVLRAMNAADLRTRGDVWFVTFTGEETDVRGARHFARAHFPHHLDWRRGDAVIQFHGGGGVGVTTGSTPVIHKSTLRVFTPFERAVPGQPGADRRWRPHAVDVLARILTRVRTELMDPRPDCHRCDEIDETAELFMNMAVIESSPIRNAPSAEGKVVFDLRGRSREHVRQVEAGIRNIAEEVCQEMRLHGLTRHGYIDDCFWLFQVEGIIGREEPIPGWDQVDNPPARMAAAASHALYGFDPVIDSRRGCGDCRATYMEGVPSISFRGDVVDYGGGRFERSDRFAQYGGLESDVRLRTSGHHETQSNAILQLWAAIKHGLVSTASYAGIAPAAED
jgi:acetylornithine deacetylase/succinyl-diaminopimelate desuccinylase-like protein